MLSEPSHSHDVGVVLMTCLLMADGTVYQILVGGSGQYRDVKDCYAFLVSPGQFRRLYGTNYVDVRVV